MKCPCEDCLMLPLCISKLTQEYYNSHIIFYTSAIILYTEFLVPNVIADCTLIFDYLNSEYPVIENFYVRRIELIIPQLRKPLINNPKHKEHLAFINKSIRLRDQR